MRIMNLCFFLMGCSLASSLLLGLVSCTLPPTRSQSTHSSPSPRPYIERSRNWSEGQLNRAQ
jgi:hypothetical protein